MVYNERIKFKKENVMITIYGNPFGDSHGVVWNFWMALMLESLGETRDAERYLRYACECEINEKVEIDL